MSKIRLLSIKIKKNEIFFLVESKKLENSGKIFLNVSSRKNKKKYVLLKPIKSNGNSLLFKMDIGRLDFQEIYWDIFLEDGFKRKRVVGNSQIQVYFRNLFRKKIKKITVGDLQYLLTCYFAVGSGLSLQLRQTDEYDNKIYQLKEICAILLLPFVYWYFRSSNLTYEKFSNYARDNSFYYFIYIQQNILKNKLYFVIKKDSPDYKKVIKYKKHVVHFMSIKHLILILSSKYFVASEAKGHAYAWRHNQSISRFMLNRKPFVFLQHGVLGLKKVDNTFFANNKLNHADLFVASSNFEKDIIVNYLGYNPQNVVTTGLARWDIKEKINKEKKIFIMPTWRVNLELSQEESFLKSNFYLEYRKLIFSDSLIKVLEDSGYIIHFMLHPKFVQFEKYFDSSSSRIQVISQNDAEIINELRSSQLVITDYSSILWDALYYNIPGILFQFDQEDYLNLQGSYLDLKKELNELIIYSMDDLIDFIILFIKDEGNNSKVDAILEKKDYYFKYHDQKNAIRIQNAISLWEKDFIFESLYQKLFKKFCRKLLKRKVTK